jgi:2',3'-cyclic-nucleotide 2'-phosphodiesterase (5'-nucleotidase family)
MNMQVSKRISSLLLIVFILSVAGLAQTQQPKTITILHTNDIHAGFIPHEALWSKENPKPLVGGFSELSFVVDSIRKIKPTLLIDAGDVMTGNPITEYEYKGAFGGALFEMMNKVGYDAWCFGNHDLDISQQNLKKLVKIAKFPTLSANVVDAKGKYPFNNKKYIILKKNGIKIGIIGITSQSLYSLVNQNNLTGLKVLSPVETTQKLVDEIDSKTDLIIALTHQGVADDSVLAANVQGLDVIVGGHSHTRLNKPKSVNDVIIVQAGGNCENLGELDLTIENDKVTHYNGKLIQLWYREDRPKNALTKFVNSFKENIDRDYSEVIGELKSDWKRENGESAIGNFITDAQREAVHADVAFMNNHGIRKDLNAGPITKRDLFEILPFRNVLTTFQLSGKQIKSVVEFYVKKRPPIQTSGITCTWKGDRGSEIEIMNIEINGKPLEDDKLYSCTVNDYLAGEAKRHIGIEVNDAIYMKLTLFGEVEKAIRKSKIIESKIENRIQEVKK